MSKVRGHKFHIIAKTHSSTSVTKIFVRQEIQPANLGVYQFEWEVTPFSAEDYRSKKPQRHRGHRD